MNNSVKKGGMKKKPKSSVEKTVTDIAKLRVNNSALAAALQSKKRECEDLKAELLEMEKQLQISNQRHLTLQNAVAKVRPVLRSTLLECLNVEDNIYGIEKELTACSNGEAPASNGATYVRDRTSQARQLLERYNLNREALLAGTGSNLSDILERSTFTDESSKECVSGLPTVINESKGKLLLPLKTGTAKARSKVTDVTKSKSANMKRGSARCHLKLPVPLPLEEVPAFQPTFQIPRTPTAIDPETNDLVAGNMKEEICGVLEEEKGSVSVGSSREILSKTAKVEIEEFPLQLFGKDETPKKPRMKRVAKEEQGKLPEENKVKEKNVKIKKEKRTINEELMEQRSHRAISAVSYKEQSLNRKMRRK